MNGRRHRLLTTSNKFHSTVGSTRRYTVTFVPGFAAHSPASHRMRRHEHRPERYARGCRRSPSRPPISLRNPPQLVPDTKADFQHQLAGKSYHSGIPAPEAASRLPPIGLISSYFRISGFLAKLIMF